MTPKEKSTELFKKYYCMSNHSKSKVKIIEFETAKKCAIITIDEIMNEHNTYYDTVGENLARIKYNYWKEVKRELEHF